MEPETSNLVLKTTLYILNLHSVIYSSGLFSVTLQTDKSITGHIKRCLFQDGRVFIWTCGDPAGNTWTAKLLHKFNDVVWHVSWSITGNILAVSGGDNKVMHRNQTHSKASIL